VAEWPVASGVARPSADALAAAWKLPIAANYQPHRSAHEWQE